MSMPRRVQTEMLDQLSEEDPAAIRSRRDLRRVHWAMGTQAMVARAIRRLAPLGPARTRLRVLELGAGDGSLMLGVARTLGPTWSAVDLTLLDRLALVDSTTIARYASLGWRADARMCDVFDWAEDSKSSRLGNDTHWDIIVANLFLHHFEGEQLDAVLAAIARSSDCFLACDPRRNWLALTGSRLIGMLGVGAVTRTDAVLSVHAGFRDHELAKAWPGKRSEWHLREAPAGLFSHCFRARYVGEPR